MKSNAAAVVMFAMLASAQVIADEREATVLAYDRVDKLIILSDKTVFSLHTLKTPVPEGLSAGKKIAIQYESNEDDGVTVIHSIDILPQ